MQWLASWPWIQNNNNSYIALYPVKFLQARGAVHYQHQNPLVNPKKKYKYSIPIHQYQNDNNKNNKKPGWIERFGFESQLHQLQVTSVRIFTPRQRCSDTTPVTFRSYVQTGQLWSLCCYWYYGYCVWFPCRRPLGSTTTTPKKKKKKKIVFVFCQTTNEPAYVTVNFLFHTSWGQDMSSWCLPVREL